MDNNERTPDPLRITRTKNAYLAFHWWIFPSHGNFPLATIGQNRWHCQLYFRSRRTPNSWRCAWTPKFSRQRHRLCSVVAGIRKECGDIIDRWNLVLSIDVHVVFSRGFNCSSAHLDEEAHTQKTPQRAHHHSHVLPHKYPFYFTSPREAAASAWKSSVFFKFKSFFRQNTLLESLSRNYNCLLWYTLRVVDTTTSIRPVMAKFTRRKEKCTLCYKARLSYDSRSKFLHFFYILKNYGFSSHCRRTIVLHYQRLSNWLMLCLHKDKGYYTTS